MESDEIRTERVRGVQQSGGPHSCGSSQRHQTAYRRTPQTGRIKSAQARTKTKATHYEAIRFLGPRFKVLVVRRRTHFAGDFGKGQALPDHTASEFAEAVTVIHFLSVIEAKCLFVHVSEQVERFNADVSSAQPTLQEATEVLQSVSVDVPDGVGFSVVNNVMSEFGLQSKVGHSLIGKEMRTRLNVLLNVADHFPAVPLLFDPLQPNLSAAFEDALNGSLAHNAAAFSLKHSFLAVFVHIASLAADEGLVSFNFAGQLAAAVLILHSESDALKHEPCGLLSHADGAVEFVAADSVLAVGKMPHSEQPLVQADRGVLEDGPDFDAELGLGMPSLALPEVSGRQETYFLGATGRAHGSILPTPRRQIANAVLGIGEVNDCILESFWFGCHDESSIIQGV